MENILRISKSVLLCLLFLIYSSLNAYAEDDILDFLPAILSTVEKKPPPPPPPAQWQVTNLVYCSSLRSVWTVSDDETSRTSEVTTIFITSTNTSSLVTVEPGERTFLWNLKTERAFTTCGAFSGSFNRTLKSGYRYEFILEPNGSGGLTISTEESEI